MKLLKTITLSVLVFLSFSASADSFCTGKIKQLAIGRSGTVLIAGPGGLPSTYLCNVNSKNNNVATEACKAIYSQLLAAQAQQKEVNITFNPAVESCSKVKSWGWATGFNWVIVND